MIATVLAVALAGCAPDVGEPTATTPARVVVDLAGGRVDAVHGATRAETTLDDSTRTALRDLRAALARGDDARALRDALGRELLAPLRAALEPADRWIWSTAGARALPGDLSTLATWSLPWAEGEPVITRHAVRLDWPRALAAQVPRPRVPRGDRVLLVAPFRDGVDARTDDPDTLRTALRHAAARVEMIPRNDVDAVRVRRALEGDAIALLWIRGTAAAVHDLRGAYGAFPAIVAWSLPSDGPAPADGVVPNTFASGGEAPALLALPVRPVPEPAIARLARAWTDGLARGRPADLALRQVQRTLHEQGRPPAEWSALVLVGEPDEAGAPQRAPWLRRAFSGRD